MLKYYIGRKDIASVPQVCSELNKLKYRIKQADFSQPRNEFDICKELFLGIKEKAVSDDCEMLANANYLFREYFILFSELSYYFSLLANKQYELSWNALQNCLDIIKLVSRFVDDRLELDDIYDLLTEYETLYPYKLFGSSEYVISKSHCSICGESMQSISCQHIRGYIYWGQMAHEVVDEIKEVRAISVVEHPEDKRCILWASDDDRPENEKFKKLDDFLALQFPLLQLFTTSSRIELRMKEGLIPVGRNETCPCGSGKKFKKCCGKNIYCRHERIIITPGKNINLVIL